jgi:hypothetical protein
MKTAGAAESPLPSLSRAASFVASLPRPTMEDFLTRTERICGRSVTLIHTGTLMNPANTSFSCVSVCADPLDPP